MNWIVSRLTESSTYRGIFAICTAIGISVSPDMQNAIIAFGLASIGLINVIIKEKPHVVQSDTVAQVNPPASGSQS